MDNRKILSKANPKVKAIRKLKNKKYRKQYGVFYVEGLRLVTEAVKQNADIDYLLYSPELLDSDFGKELIHSESCRQLDILEVTREVFESFSLKEGPQGIAAVVKINSQPLQEWEITQGTWVALEETQDPGNLGSILRTMDAVGAKGLILLGDSTDPYHPTAVRASMGALFTLRIAKINQNDFYEIINKNEPHIVGTICKNGLDYRSYNYPKNVIVLMGSEQKGIKDELLSICTGLVHIPMIGNVDSLNLSNATSIILYEIFSQHHKINK